MAIDPRRAVGADLGTTTFTWDEQDVILYNLALGAGDPPDDSVELRYVYEADLHAIPTYGTIPPFAMMMALGQADGIDIDLVQILHGSQQIIIHSPIPTSGTVSQTGSVIDVYDRVRGALILLEVVSTSEKTGEPLFANRAGVYVRGEGGFGGEPGPGPVNAAPERVPDLVVESPTLPQQALLYRLASGDRNPLHADPAFAAMAGFERPILHGLCTYGVVAKTVIDAALGGDTDAVAGFDARFSGHVFPGETLVTSVWDEGNRLVVSAATKEREKDVLSNAAITVRR